MTATNQPTSSLTADDVRKVAKLARLAIPDEQIESYRTKLGAVLDSMAAMSRLDLSNVEPMSHPTELVNRLRDDTPGPTLSNETLMQLAPKSMPPFVHVPKVIGEGGGA